MYEVYDYNPRTGRFYVTCKTDNPEVAARWFRFLDLKSEYSWKYLKRTAK